MLHDNTKRWRLLAALMVAVMLVALMSVLVGAQPAQAQDKRTLPLILPPDQSVWGMTYGQWSALWYQWMFRIPVHNPPVSTGKLYHPLYVDKRVNCGIGQSGNVWFLGGTFTTVDTGGGNALGTADRTCTIPADTWLFFPIMNAECSSVEGNGTTQEALTQCAADLRNAITKQTLSLEIDGTSVPNLYRYQVASPMFSIGPLPQDNVLAAATGATGNAVSDGYYVMVKPLSLGAHQIHFAATAAGTTTDNPPKPWSFTLNIRYRLVVVPDILY
ncbi:MAG: hypothetical protein U0822_13690 [Anaerolineae bacterium]